MTHDRCIELLSEHLDGTLPPAEAGAVRSHLEGCPACAGVEAELRAVVTAAGALEPREPERDLWPGIASAIGGRHAAPDLALAGWRRDRRPSRRVSFSVPQLAAAALVLALASGGTAWWARPGATPTAPAATSATSPPGGARVAGAPLPRERTWAREVARLEAALAEAEGLDASTVRLLERNLEIIDRAIRESRAALAEDPGNAFLEEHLERSWARKVATLREAADIAGWPRS